MNYIKNTLVYLLLLVYDVKTIVNDAEKLENCVTNIRDSSKETNKDNGSLLKLIDQNTVILKAFCSENLINFADENDELEVNADNKLVVKDVESDDDDDEDYNTDYFYKSNEKEIKTLMILDPITVYKGQLYLRQLELFNNQEFFLIKGQLNATLELDMEDKTLYQKKCYCNPKINNQGQILNDNHLIEKQIRYLLPGKLILFGKLDNNNGLLRNRLIVKTSAIIRWQPHVENFVWDNLGWSSWGKWSPCSKSCKGIQQRHRHCLKNQQMARNGKASNEMEESESTQQPNQQLCKGYNIEQRECNLFECKDAVNLLPMTKNTIESSAHINHLVDSNNFTIMFTIRSKVTREIVLQENFGMSQHIVSLWSNTEQSCLTISLIETGIKVVQEKNASSEKFDLKLNLFDLHWHQIAFGFRKDGLITCFVDCSWDHSILMTKGSFEVPPDARVEMNSKLNNIIEWKQLNLVSGNHERSQCSNERTPIYDNTMALGRMFNDETN